MPLLRRRTPRPSADLQVYRPQTMARRSALPRAMTASAQAYNLRDKVDVAKMGAYRENWQNVAWTYRRALGELRYAVEYLGNSSMRMRYFPASYIPGEQTPVAAEDAGLPTDLVMMAHALLARLATGGPLAMAALQKKMTENLQVAGECYLVGTVDPDTMVESWDIRSTSELEVTRDGRVGIKDRPNASQGDIQWLDPDAEMIRLWWPDPEFGQKADSPVRAVLDVCEELILLGRDVRATARSRIANNGVLLMPDTLFVARMGNDNADNVEGDPFLAEITETMTAAMSDEGSAAAVVPLLLRGPAAALDAVRHMTLDRPEHQSNIAARSELISRLATGLDLPSEVLTGKADLNHWCKPAETRCLTRDGWRFHHEIEIGTEVLTLNHDTGLSEWQPVLDIYRADVSGEPMVRLVGSRAGTVMHNSLSTLAHRWPVIRDGARVWTTSEAVHPGDLITLGAPAADLPTEPKWSDAFVQLVAWYSCDGTQTGTTPQVRIGKSHKENPDKVARLRTVFTALFGPAATGDPVRVGVPRSGDPVPRWKEDRQSRGMTLFCPNKAATAELLAVVPGKDKIIPLDFVRSLTEGQLRLFLDAVLDADGSAGREIGQKSAARLDAFELAAVLLGHGVRRYVKESGGFERFPMHMLSIRKTTHLALQAEPETYSGTIWCPVTPNGSWYAESNSHGYFTGNSAWQVDDDAFRHHIEPIVVVQVDALTLGYLWPMLDACKLWPPDMVRRILIWYDPTELVTHPDRTQDALQLWDRIALSDEALRRITGFSENDAPGAQEILFRMATHVRTLDPAVQQAILKRLDPSLNIVEIGPKAPATDAEGAGAAPAGPPAVGAPAAPAAPAGAGPAGAPAQPGPPPAPAGGPPPAGGAAPAGASDLRARALAARNEFVDEVVRDPTVLLRSLAAASPLVGVSEERRAASRRLTDIDRTLRTRLVGASNQAVKRALEKAGAKVLTKTRGAAHRTIRASIEGLPAWQVPSKVGLALCASMGVTEQTILDEQLADLKAQWDRWTAEASDQALRAAAKIAGVDATSAYTVLKSKFATDSKAGWAYLEQSLQARVTALLTDDPVQTTQAIDAVLVGSGPIRAALALAGGFGNTLGSAGLDRATGLPADPSEIPSFGGIATGPTVSGFLSDNGQQIAAYQWVHGASDRPFEPHEDLDGTVFGSFDDDVLAVDGDFPDTGWYAPGDHDGCTCDFTPIWIDVSESDDSSDDSDSSSGSGDSDSSGGSDTVTSDDGSGDDG